MPTGAGACLAARPLSGVREFLAAFEGLPEDPSKTCADLMIAILARVGYMEHLGRDEEKELNRRESLAHLRRPAHKRAHDARGPAPVRARCGPG